MKILFMLLLVGCSSQEREIKSVCELTCIECKSVELKCDSIHKKDKKEVGNVTLP